MILVDVGQYVQLMSVDVSFSMCFSRDGQPVAAPKEAFGPAAPGTGAGEDLRVVRGDRRHRRKPRGPATDQTGMVQSMQLGPFMSYPLVI